MSAIAQQMHLEGATVLEVGCGSALDGIELARRGAHAVAVDFSAEAIRGARAHAEAAGSPVWLAVGDGLALPFAQGSFDLVFSLRLPEHFRDPVPVILEQRRVLRPRGLLCIDVPQTFSPVALRTRWRVLRGTWFAGWETSFTLGGLERLLRRLHLPVVASYGYLYSQAGNAVRNLHTLDERHRVPVWIGPGPKHQIERLWAWLEGRRWYYRWQGCIGVVGQKTEE